MIGSAGFGVLIRGESMSNRAIHDGDVVWVNPERSPRIGRPVLARVWALNGHEDGMVVKVLKHENGLECLWSDGDPPEGRAVFPCSRFEVIGPVVGISPAFRLPT